MMLYTGVAECKAWKLGEEAVSLKDVVKETNEQDFEARIDTALVNRAVSGELAAFRLLVERYQQRIFSVALGIMGNREDAEDVVQEAFVKAFRNLRSFRKESSFYTWLYRIVYNFAIDEKRKRYRHVESAVGDSRTLDLNSATTSPSPTTPGVLGPDADIERQELQSHIKAAMSSLSADHRAVIMLREVDGLSYAEISDVVGVSKGTVMSRLHHARRKLQKFLKKYAPEVTENLELQDDVDFESEDQVTQSVTQKG